MLYVRNEAKPSVLNTIVLYEFETGRVRDLVHGMVSKPFWSPDDTRIAYLNATDQISQVWALTPDAPERAAAFSAQNVIALQGWSDARTVVASDAQSVYWLSEDKPTQVVALREICGDAFNAKPLDTLRLNPANPDLLLVSAAFASVPTGAAADATGTAYGLFLYELRSKRRVVVSPVEQIAKHGEWSRDGLQVFYTRQSAAASSIFRMFWDASGNKRYAEGSDLVIGQ